MTSLATGYRLLVVAGTDEHGDAMRLLFSRRHEVVVAESASDALEQVRKREFDLAIVSHRLDGMSGVELLTRIRDVQEDCIRFLVVQDKRTDPLQDALAGAGVYRFVHGPIDGELLTIDVQRALEHREASRQLARTRGLSVVGQMCVSVTHDMRNYLQILNVAPELLVSDVEPDRERMAGHIQSSVDAMNDLVAELASLARGVAPRYVQTREDLGQLVSHTVALVQAAYPERAGQIHVSVSPDLPLVGLSRLRCERMISNLINNALDAADTHGSVRLRVYAEHDHVCVEVQDSGCGVTEAVRQRIFEPLYSTKGRKGLGLGLAVAKAVMDGHHGTIECDSAVGRGTTFTAKFPVRPPG